MRHFNSLANNKLKASAPSKLAPPINRSLSQAILSSPQDTHMHRQCPPKYFRLSSCPRPRKMSALGRRAAAAAAAAAQVFPQELLQHFPVCSRGGERIDQSALPRIVLLLLLLLRPSKRHLSAKVGLPISALPRAAAERIRGEPEIERAS